MKVTFFKKNRGAGNLVPETFYILICTINTCDQVIELTFCDNSIGHFPNTNE
ncbi:hypothetical protein T11_13881 [Trichinella zimbabwensis]|uniref:Uncharacterized protein n=1 Tax=Trichinella zimbabwensis TaxID=268475 RepID=A0A0V1GK11_9BILA|nr:hypothetical protein T11_12425 [Trichinella zimbabwensis]KRY99774.1 hypothetical protein T11_13881 [Trichinella zimbabwensis]